MRTSNRRAFTRTEIVVVIIVLFGLFAIIIPGLDTGAREAARRIQCTNNLKQIGLAIHSYAQAHRVFPPGTICSTAPVEPGNQYDAWSEAARTEHGFQGTSLLLTALPFMESTSDSFARSQVKAKDIAWDYSYGVSGKTNLPTAVQDIRDFYCPSRRNALRPGDNVMMLSSACTGGGTDYGGCAGRHAAFSLTTGYNLCDATTHYQSAFKPKPYHDPQLDEADPKRSCGIFGRANVCTKLNDVRDGLCDTIMTGELQRITDLQPTSKDGWAIGGPATLFTTGAMTHRDGKNLTFVNSPKDGKLFNNGFFGSPGSEHPRGANFGLGDGSVRFIIDSIDPNIFAFMGSMADGNVPAMTD